MSCRTTPAPTSSCRSCRSCASCRRWRSSPRPARWLGHAARELAGLLPGASVVAAEYETAHADAPLGLAARNGEPVVVLLGDHEFELELDTPPR
jgi:hypothetical protein